MVKLAFCNIERHIVVDSWQRVRNQVVVWWMIVSTIKKRTLTLSVYCLDLLVVAREYTNVGTTTRWLMQATESV